MKHWIIEEAHNQNWLFDCEYSSYEEAVYNLNCIEETDKFNNEYVPGHYRIVEIETNISIPDDCS